MDRYLAYGKPLADSGIHLPFAGVDLQATGIPTEWAGAGVEGLPQTTLLLSFWGCNWGPTPLGSMITSTY